MAAHRVAESLEPDGMGFPQGLLRRPLGRALRLEVGHSAPLGPGMLSAVEADVDGVTAMRDERRVTGHGRVRANRHPDITVPRAQLLRLRRGWEVAILRRVDHPAALGVELLMGGGNGPLAL